MTGSDNKYEYACPKCNHVNALRGRALTTALTCKKCGVYFCLHANIQDQFQSKFDPAIPIGSRGTFEGKMFEVMGFCVKRELKYRYTWREYLLFNPHHGIAFLTEYGGNWNFLTPYAKHPWSYSQRADLVIEEGDFKLYAKYKADVLFASGEFFLDVIHSTESSVHYEHICPPYILNFESNNKQISAYLGKYISPENVATAFQLEKKKLPKKEGMGYTQPLLFAFSEATMIMVTAFAIALATLILIFFNSDSSSQVVFQNHFSENDMKGQKMFTTKSFVLDGYMKNLEVKIYAPVSNDWFFAEYALINEETQDEYAFTNEIEYYYGYEGGESWREGSNYSEAFLSSIPGGKYHINIYPEFSLNNHEFDITVYRDVPFYSNYVIVFIMLLLFPIGFYIYRHYREVRRWSESDYSPYRVDDE